MTGSGEWVDGSTYLWAFEGFALDDVVTANFNVVEFGGIGPYCETCSWPGE